MRILESMEADDFEQVICLQNRRFGLRAFLAIHDTTRGPAFGGVRRWHYPNEGQALRDVLRLARGMTFKCAMAGVAGGGGKVVLLDHVELDREAAYEILGRTVENLGGRFYTGPDVGTGEDELEILSRFTGYVTRPGPEGPGDLAQATAEGALYGLRACLQHVYGSDDPASRHFVVQGVGEVGSRLARLLVDLGAQVSIADIDETKAQRLGEELDLRIVPPGEVFDLECDVFCPCAMGGVLHDLSINRLSARIVAGSANNVLATPEHGARLHDRGIVYAPDYIINAGALIRGSSFHLGGPRDVSEALARIGTEIAWVLAESERTGLPPDEVADQEARRRVAEVKGAGDPYFPDGGR